MIAAPSLDRRARVHVEHVLFAAAVAAALAPLLLFPGDAPFINDEPLLLAAALDANEAGRLAEAGLLGTAGVRYGPLPTWIYQALLYVTKSPTTLVTLRSLLMAGATTGALLSLARSTGLWRWFVPVALASPYFWFYGRVLWDNPFCIPLGLWVLAGYADHLRTGRHRGLAIAAACGAAALLVHLMSVALLVPVAGHALSLRWRSLLRAAPLWATASALVLAPALPYLRMLLGSPSSAAGGSPQWEGVWFPLLGGRVLGGAGLDYLVAPSVLDGTWLQALARMSSASYALLWLGLAVAAWRALAALRSGQATPAEHLGAISVAVLLAQAVLHGWTGRTHHPHYYNGTWGALLVVSWLAATWLARSMIGRVAMAAYGCSLLGVTSALLLRLHARGGDRGPFGPTLDNQLEVARALEALQPRTTSTAVPSLARFPHALATLRRLAALRPPATPSRTPRSARALVRYQSAEPADGRIELVVFERG